MKDVFALIGIASVFLVAYVLVVKGDKNGTNDILLGGNDTNGSKAILIEETPCYCGEIVLQGYDVQNYDVKPYFNYPAIAKV